MAGTRRKPMAPITLTCELLAGIVLLGLATLMGVVFVHRPWPNRLDAKGFSLFPSSNAPTYHFFTHFGTLRVLVIAVIAGAVLNIWRDFGRTLACVAGPLAAAEITQHIAKPLVGRHLTAFGANSFPSGTVTGVTAIAVVLFLTMPRLLRPVAALVGAFFIIAAGVSVIALRWHYPTDVLGGIGVGAGAVLICDALAHIPRRRRSVARVPQREVFSGRRELLNAAEARSA